ncbi:MAG TPA: YbaB/EbfC family nucleoid-associated protein [Acetobacteraceae bacterium]|nr:YbaB/EbfC family nucleoid-associated protein [Acetobacteraceae bacterium]
MKNIAGMMKQAAQMQKKMEEMQAALEATEREGVAGAGMVTVRLDGKGQMRSVKIDPKLADPAEMEMLQDLILAAHEDAKRKIEAAAAEEMQKITGGLDLPAGMKLPF